MEEILFLKLYVVMDGNSFGDNGRYDGQVVVVVMVFTSNRDIERIQSDYNGGVKRRKL